MKKNLAVMLAVVTSALMITACGGKQENTTSGSTPADVVSASEAVSEVENTTDAILEDFTGEMDLSGSWQDEISQRATMDATKNEDGTYTILVHWGGSATEAAIWEITGTYDETSGMLSYDNGSYSIHTFDDENNDTISDEETTSGAFMKEGEKLRWQDSKNSEDALFTKVE